MVHTYADREKEDQPASPPPPPFVLLLTPLYKFGGAWRTDGRNGRGEGGREVL